jgi:hypothetical protein
MIPIFILRKIKYVPENIANLVIKNRSKNIKIELNWKKKIEISFIKIIQIIANAILAKLGKKLVVII